MPPNPPVLCSACGYELGPPDQEIYHEEEGQTPDDPHFEVVSGEKGERMKCVVQGQFASPTEPGDSGYIDLVKEHGYQDRVPDDALQGGDGGSPQSEQSSGKNPDPGGPEPPQNSEPDQVFDIDEEKTQLDILKDVVTSPHYELNEAQVQEIVGWAEDYNNQLPPNELQSILQNMSGVAKQKAELVAKRYSIKLNNWMREQNSQNDGPPIGVLGPSPGPQGQQSRRRPSPSPPSRSPSPQPQGSNGEDTTENQDDGGTQDLEPEDRGSPSRDVGPDGSVSEIGEVSKKRRERRVERRNDAADIAIEEAAKQAAPEIARELTSNMGKYFGLPAKVFEAKAEQDPDWFLEKADEIEEKLGISIFDLLEPSEAKKERDANGSSSATKQQSQVDSQLDDALSEIGDDTQQASNNTQNVQDTETTKQRPEQRQTEREANPMKSQPDNTMTEEQKTNSNQESQEDKEEAADFDDIFGGDD